MHFNEDWAANEVFLYICLALGSSIKTLLEKYSELTFLQTYSAIIELFQSETENDTVAVGSTSTANGDNQEYIYKFVSEIMNQIYVNNNPDKIPYSITFPYENNQLNFAKYKIELRR